MINQCILTKFPSELLDLCKEMFNSIDKDSINQLHISKIHSANLMPASFVSKVNSFLPLPLNSLSIYIVRPNKRMLPHYDRGRKTALQIPMEMDHENSYTFAARYRDLSRYTPVNEKYQSPIDDAKWINRPEHPFYAWDDELFDTYDMKLPILQNSNSPHGGVNMSEKPRFFFSGSYTRLEYDFVKEAFIDFY